MFRGQKRTGDVIDALHTRETSIKTLLRKLLNDIPVSTWNDTDRGTFKSTEVGDTFNVHAEVLEWAYPA
ncbi:MAG: hypothetical protein HY063_14500 [Bacteroidetes bacterium]|nr:hypothetical protein [Bacteroidota bacterium]